MNASATTAYAAGVIDANGLLVIGASKYGRGLVSHWLQVSVRSPWREPLDWLQAEFGGKVTGSARAPRSGFIWRLMAHDALAFLLRVRPLLRMKGKHADIAIAFQREKKSLAGLGTIERHTELTRRAGSKALLEQLTRRRKITRATESVRATQRRFPGTRL